MTCDCIDKIEKELRKRYGDGFTGLDYITIPFFGGQSKVYTMFKYKPTKKDGTLYKTNKSQSLIFTYCPFCGIKYKEG